MTDSTPNMEMPTELLTEQMSAMILDARKVARQILKLESADDDLEELCGTPRVYDMLPGLYRKLQQARKEMAELFGKGILPEGLGDEAAGDVDTASDTDSDAANAMLARLFSEVLQTVRPTLSGHKPEISPEELEADYEAQLGQIPKDKPK